MLKNAIDWASTCIFPGKGEAVTFAQTDIRLVEHGPGSSQTRAGFYAALIFTCELIIGGISQAIGPDAQITDEIVQKMLKRHVEGFLAFMLKMGSAHAA